MQDSTGIEEFGVESQSFSLAGSRCIRELGHEPECTKATDTRQIGAEKVDLQRFENQCNAVGGEK